MSTSYATRDQLVRRLPSLATKDPDELDDLLEASSRWIDGYCSRRFWLDPSATARVFQACDLYILDLGAHEIGSLTGVIVKTDDGSGTYATTISAASYRLEPVNAPFAASGAAPYTRIRSISGAWPVFGAPSGVQELVQVTAKYGWPSVPAGVREACLALTVDRAENPTGVRSEAVDGYSVRYGVADGGDDAVSPKVKAALSTFRRGWAA